MPALNSRKKYLENGYYHIYNRGVEKRKIFEDIQDYKVFASYLKNYLIAVDKNLLQEKLSNHAISARERDNVIKDLRRNNFSDEISLIAYCLMPNHFHFLIKQNSADSIDIFMNSLGTRYTMYFNRKYKRVGSLYQGVYKAVLVETDEQLLYLTKYIHKQALSNLQGETLESHPSSFGEFIGSKYTNWVKPEEILKSFSEKKSNLSYKNFVLDNKSADYIVGNLLLEKDL